MLDTKLETLLVLQQEQNFTKASEKLGITQPAVSTHIKQLEETYGCKLFVRSKNDVKPTEKGAIVIDYAKRLKRIHQKMLDELANHHQLPTKLRVGLTHSGENSSIISALGNYSKNNENISFTIFTNTNKQLYTMLENDELDLIIVEEKKTGKNLSFIDLGTDEILAIASSSNPLSKEKQVQLEQLKKEKMIMRLPTSATYQLFQSALQQVNQSIDDLHVILEVDNVSTIKDLIIQNVGMGILPQGLCKDEIRQGLLQPLAITGLKMLRQTSLVFLDDFSYRHILEDIVNILNQR